VAVVGAVVVAGFIAFLVWDTWSVNHDGTFYMALAHNLRHGAGYAFPDGSVATFRGPGYPGLLAAGWLILPETARSAIWVSRAALLLVPGVVALMLWRWTASWWIALSVGVVAAIQPWLLISGGQFFVPDGLAAGLALAAVLVYAWDRDELPTTGRVVASGALFGAAFLVKDPLLLAALAPVGVAATRSGMRIAIGTAGLMSRGFLVVTLPWFLYALIAGDSLPQGLGGLTGAAAWALLAGVGAFAWFVPRLAGTGGGAVPFWGVVVAVFVLSVAGFVVVAGVSLSGLADLWDSLTADLQSQLYRDSAWGLLLVAITVAVAWGIYRRDQIPEQISLLVTLIGVVGLLFTALSGGGLRNAILLPLGLVLLLGLATAGVTALRPVLGAVAGALLIGVFLVSVQASSAIDERLEWRALTAESPSTRAAATWLAEKASGEPVIGTPLFTQSLWRLSGADTPWHLLPTHVMGRADWEVGRRSFDELVDWAGTTGTTGTVESAAAYTLNRTTTGAYFADTIEQEIRSSGAAFVVVTGNTRFSQSAFDAGGILPLLEAAEGLTPVYRTDPAAPQWVVIYQVDGPVVVPDLPVVIHLTSSELDAPMVESDQVVLDGPAYGVMVDQVLGRAFEE
jgi:hypothetical protein